MNNPDSAWCSHCEMREPMRLETAIVHRLTAHPNCLSCTAEILLFKAFLYNAVTAVHAPDAKCDCDCTPGRHCCLLCEAHGSFTYRYIFD